MKKKIVAWVHARSILARCVGCLVIVLLIGFMVFLLVREPSEHREYKGNGKATMIDK